MANNCIYSRRYETKGAKIWLYRPFIIVFTVKVTTVATITTNKYAFPNATVQASLSKWAWSEDLPIGNNFEIVFLRSHAVHVHNTFSIYNIKLVPILLN